MAHPGARPDDEETAAAERRQIDRSDQLSPNRALQKSLGSSGSQRLGDNGPLANPVVSFPDESAGETAPAPGRTAEEPRDAVEEHERRTGAGGGS
jgi:hypothetical protein